MFVSYLKRGFIIPVFLIFFTNIFAEPADTTLFKIQTKASLIKKAAKTFGVKKEYVAAIIFAERTLNFDWKDDALDIPMAETGYNSSIGFCQIKMKTAYWIEVQLSDPTSEFYPGRPYQKILPISKSPGEIIQKLQNDSLNILYAAAYIKIIQNYWQKAGFPIHNRPDILGTLYSTGFYKPNGEIREPNANPKANAFGKKTQEACKIFTDKTKN